MKKNESKKTSSWIWLIIIAALIAGYFFHLDVYFRTMSDQEAEVVENIYDKLTVATWDYTEGEEGYEEGCIQAVTEKAEEWKEDGIVKNIETNENYVEIKFKSGLKYIYTPKRDGEDSLGVSEDVEILTYQPCLDTYPSTASEEMTYPVSAAESLANLSDSWNYTSKLVNDEVLPSSIENMGENQVILWHGHGNYLTDDGPILQLGEKFDLEKYRTDKDYQKRFNYGELYVAGDNAVVATSKFFKNTLNSLDNSVVYLGSCSSGYTDELANVFLDKGAVAVIANSDTIRTAYNTRMMKSVASYLGQRYDDGSYMDLQTALRKAKQEWGEDDSVSFGGSGATAVIYGGSDAREFQITDDTPYEEPDTEESDTDPAATEETSVDPQALYDAFLSENVSNSYYAFVDMNGDGIDELLVAQKATDLTGDAYPSDITMCLFADVYTIQDDTVTYAGNIGSNMENLSYNSANHSVQTYWGGSGYSQFIFYTIDESGSLITNYLTYSLDDDMYYYGEDDVSSENSIDESTYNEYYNLWNSDKEYISFQWR
jgi:hypothetical protein